ncbi:IS1634 family transposase, partial [Aliarcobacter cryaerophilus]
SMVTGGIRVSFYDVTTLYFEASSEDDLRKVGFSKDGKFTKPQIILGLLTSLEGYPLGFEIHEGNCYEGKTFIPMLEKFQKKFNIEKPIVVADSGLLSKANILELEKLNYRYILGARIKSSSSEIKNKIVSLNLNDEKNIETIYFSKNQKMIVSYSQQRAKKDRYTRTKNYEKLKIKIKSGNLTKAHLNNKGYNKYLVLSDSQTTISIDEDKYNYDSSFDGLKGFVTNDFSLNPTQIIEHYTNLWHIERAFRISKTDLKIRPIYHRLEHRIYSHILISFVAYTVYKEFDRKLKINNISIKRKNAIGFIKSMYGIVHDNEISLLELSPE